jgi:hypothetical protein
LWPCAASSTASTCSSLTWNRFDESSRDRCYNLLNICAEKFGEKIGVFDPKLCKTKLCKILIIHNIGFWEKRQYFRRKLSKIAENCDRNIDPSFTDKNL